MLVRDNSQCLNSVHECHPTQLPHEDHVAQVCRQVLQPSPHVTREVSLLRVDNVCGVIAATMPQVPRKRRQYNNTEVFDNLKKQVA
jgi:hypothetical protein